MVSYCVFIHMTLFYAGSSTSLAERLKESGLDIDIAELTGESLADCSTPPIKPLTTENPKI